MAEEVSADRRIDQIVERYRAREWAEALMLCERGLEADPDYLELGYYQGLCLLELERLQQGESVLEAMAAGGHLQSRYQPGLLRPEKNDYDILLCQKPHFWSIFKDF